MALPPRTPHLNALGRFMRLALLLGNDPPRRKKADKPSSWKETALSANAMEGGLHAGRRRRRRRGQQQQAGPRLGRRATVAADAVAWGGVDSGASLSHFPSLTVKLLGCTLQSP